MIKLITPLRPNQCRICGGRLRLVEVERCSYILDERGTKDNFMQEDFYDAYLQCTSCGCTMDTEKHGLHYCPKKILPEVQFEIKNYNPFQKID